VRRAEGLNPNPRSNPHANPPPCPVTQYGPNSHPSDSVLTCSRPRCCPAGLRDRQLQMACRNLYGVPISGTLVLGALA